MDIFASMWRLFSSHRVPPFASRSLHSAGLCADPYTAWSCGPRFLSQTRAGRLFASVSGGFEWITMVHLKQANSLGNDKMVDLLGKPQKVALLPSMQFYFLYWVGEFLMIFSLFAFKVIQG